jgi:hypothetical protein
MKAIYLLNKTNKYVCRTLKQELFLTQRGVLTDAWSILKWLPRCDRKSDQERFDNPFWLYMGKSWNFCPLNEKFQMMSRIIFFMQHVNWMSKSS